MYITVRIASWAPASPGGHTNSAKIQVTLNQSAGILMQSIMVIILELPDFGVGAWKLPEFRVGA